MTIHLFRYPGILPQRQRTHEDLDFAVFNHSYPDVVAEGEPTIDNGAKTASVATASKNELGRQAGSSGMPLSNSPPQPEQRPRSMVRDAVGLHAKAGSRNLVRWEELAGNLSVANSGMVQNRETLSCQSAFLGVPALAGPLSG